MIILLSTMGPGRLSDPVLAKETQDKFARKMYLILNKKTKPSEEKVTLLIILWNVDMMS